MACARCRAETPDPAPPRRRWCADCERAYDAWSRQHAADIVWVVLSGGLVMALIGILVPLLGAPWIFAASGALASWGTIFGLYKLNARRRRGQFLDGDTLPRAYLPAPRS